MRPAHDKHASRQNDILPKLQPCVRTGSRRMVLSLAPVITHLGNARPIVAIGLYTQTSCCHWLVHPQRWRETTSCQRLSSNSDTAASVRARELSLPTCLLTRMCCTFPFLPPVSDYSSLTVVFCLLCQCVGSNRRRQIFAVPTSGSSSPWAYCGGLSSARPHPRPNKARFCLTVVRLLCDCPYAHFSILPALLILLDSL